MRAALLAIVLWGALLPLEAQEGGQQGGQTAGGQAGAPAQEQQAAMDNKRGAAEGGTGDYYLKDTGNGKDFVQKLNCPEQDGVLNYEFVIEQYDEASGSWNRIKAVKTSDGKAEVSLKAGKYRYKVILYNYLDSPEAESGWAEVEIKKAYEPKISDVGPKLIYLEEENDGRFTVSGTDLMPETVYSLDSQAGLKLAAVIEDNDSRNVRARLRVDINKLDVGVYTLNAVNPGGLASASPEVVVKFRKPFDIDVAAGYSPFFALYDDTIAEYYNQTFWPLGAGLKIEVLPFKHNYGSFGFLLDGRYVYMTGTGSGYTITGNSINVTINYAFQTFIYKRKLLFCVYAGAGISMLSNMVFDFGNDVYSDVLNSMYICGDAGLSLRYHFNKSLYVELEGNFSHAFLGDIMLGCAMLGRAEPRLSAGWRF